MSSSRRTYAPVRLATASKKEPGIAPRLRVVYLDHVARMSGGEIALLRTLPAVKQHVDVHVVLGEDGPLVELLRQEGIRTTVLPLSPRVRDTRRDNVVGLSSAAGALDLCRYVLALRSLLRREAPDLIHTNSLKAALYGGVAGRLARVPVLWHVRDRLTNEYLSSPTRRVVRLAARILPSAIVANSASTRSTLPERRGTSLLLNPVVADSVKLSDARLRKENGTFVVGMVGRLSAWKGQDLFLRAFAEAFEDLPSVQARIIGSALFGEDAYAQGLGRLVVALGIRNRVDFVGFRADVWQELAGLDVLVHASVVAEPFGQVVLEGMAAGVPVVASGEGGPAEIIRDGIDGLLFKPRSVKDLAVQLRRLQEDADLRQRLAVQGRVSASRYSPESTAQALLRVYQGMMPADSSV